MGVRPIFHQAFLHKVVDDPLDVLTVASPVAREPGDRLRSFCCGDRAEHLPAGTREADAGDQPLMRIETFEPVSENPVFTVHQAVAGTVRASGRDNNGNTFSVLIAP